MLDNNLIQSTSAWPFVEIRKLLKERKDLIKAIEKSDKSHGHTPYSKSTSDLIKKYGR